MKAWLPRGWRDWVAWAAIVAVAAGLTVLVGGGSGAAALIAGPVMWMLHRLDVRNTSQHQDNQAVLADIRSDVREAKDDVRDVKADVRDVKADVRQLDQRVERLESKEHP